MISFFLKPFFFQNRAQQKEKFETTFSLCFEGVLAPFLSLCLYSFHSDFFIFPSKKREEKLQQKTSTKNKKQLTPPLFSPTTTTTFFFIIISLTATKTRPSFPCALLSLNILERSPPGRQKTHFSQRFFPPRHSKKHSKRPLSIFKLFFPPSARELFFSPILSCCSLRKLCK